MNAKNLIVWVCLAVMLISEVFLFRANHERDQAVAGLHDAQQQLHDTQTELDNLKNSTAGQSATENSGLRKQNELLTAKVSSLQQTVDRLQKESQQTAQHLTTARSALELQQQHLQELQAQQQQAVMIANANTCIGNLRAINVAKAQWALDKQKSATDVPTTQDLLPYLKDGTFPVCPDGGSYTLNAAGDAPTCSTPGHVLPPQ